MDIPRLNLRQARRLAVAQAGLAFGRTTGLPSRASGPRLRAAMRAIVRHFGYLQIDSIAISGARTQAIVLGSRLLGALVEPAERLLVPDGPYFEYWGHEASWLPIESYPLFEFRRREYRIHPWWGDVLGEHRDAAGYIVDRIRAEGPLRSLDFEHAERRVATSGWGSGKLAPKVLEALWSAGELAVRERVGFQRYFDLTERVIPDRLRHSPVDEDDAIEALLLRALDGHGWASTGTLAATWRLRNRGAQIKAALDRLAERAQIVPCELAAERVIGGWIRPQNLAVAERLGRARMAPDAGVLLSPFDPLLWDRVRVARLFGFEQRLEIYKPRHERQYGYYCLPVLAGDQLIGRVDLKAERDVGRLQVLAHHFEAGRAQHASAREAMARALERFAGFVGLELQPPRGLEGPRRSSKAAR